MDRRYFTLLITLSALSLLLIAQAMVHREESLQPDLRPLSHPLPPFHSYIYGSGVVEAGSNNISIGTALNYVVEKIFVKVGDHVKEGDPLLQLDDQEVKANYARQKQAYTTAVARLKRLDSLPQPDELRYAEAALALTIAERSYAKDQYEMVRSLQDPRSISQEEANRRRSLYEEAEAKFQQAQAQLEKIRAGSWKPDRDIAESELLEAKAMMDQALIAVERTLLRSPLDGSVLQVNIHRGELPQANGLNKPMMILGNLDELHLRVDINQFDAPYHQANARAVAFLQHGSPEGFPLECIEVGQLLVDKRDLTNDIHEKVDTRVLQAVYRFQGTIPHLLVGEKMDVYIEASESL